MLAAALQPDSAWAEDRATLRSDPSAVPGAKTDGAARGRPVLHSPHRDWHQSDKPSQQDAVTALAGCLSLLANSNRSTFHFPLNQDNAAERYFAFCNKLNDAGAKWSSVFELCPFIGQITRDAPTWLYNAWLQRVAAAYPRLAKGL